MRRPDVFTLDYSHPLAHGLVFADVGGLPAHEDRSLVRANALGTPELIYSHDIGRRVFSGFSSTQYVSLPQNIVSLPLGDFTASILFKATSAKSANCVMAWGGTDDILIYGPESSPTVRVFWRDIGGNLGTTTIPSLGDWCHVCLVSRGDADHRVYINGVDALSSTASKASVGPFTTARVGQWADSVTQFFNGYIADPIFHNRALSPAEIALLADRTDPMLGGLIVEDRPVLYFDMGGSAEVEGPAVVTAESTIALLGQKGAISAAVVAASASLGMGGAKQAVAPLNIVGSISAEASGSKSTSSPATITATADFLASGIKAIIGLDKEGPAVVTASATVGMGGVKGGVGAAVLGADLAVEAGGMKGAAGQAWFDAMGEFYASRGPDDLPITADEIGRMVSLRARNYSAVLAKRNYTARLS